MKKKVLLASMILPAFLITGCGTSEKNLNCKFYNDLYKKHIEAFSNGTFIEYGTESKNTIEKYHITVPMRRSLGGDIDAACGQLRRKYEG